MSFSCEMVTKDVEGVAGVAEGAGHVFGETALDQISAQASYWRCSASGVPGRSDGGNLFLLVRQ